ncbi:MAG: DEAD/DEAH box helicase [Chitinivorax sp.]
MIEFTRKDVLRWFGAQQLAKAEEYIPRVLALDVQGKSVLAQVQGNMREPYRVRVSLFGLANGQLRATSHCTCPVANGCKHGAAAMLAYLAQQNPTPSVNPEVIRWLAEFGDSMRSDVAPRKPSKQAFVLFYVLCRSSTSQQYYVTFLKAKRHDNGTPYGYEEWNNVERAIMKPPQFVAEDDVTILRLLWMQNDRNSNFYGYKLAGKNGDEILQRMLDSGRLMLQAEPQLLGPFTAGEPCSAELCWRSDASGNLAPDLKFANGAGLTLLPAAPWYADSHTLQIGRAQVGIAPQALARILALPPLAPIDLPLVSQALREWLPSVPVPDQVLQNVSLVDVAPKLLLQLDTLPLLGVGNYRQYRYNHAYGNARLLFDVALPRFDYGGHVVSYGDKQEYLTLANGEVVRLKRDLALEKQRIKTLAKFDLQPLPANLLYKASEALPPGMFALAQEADWPAFVSQAVPLLVASGWQISHTPRFRHWQFEVSSWHAALSDTDAHWFDLALQIEVAGQRIDLPPLLSELIRREPRWLDSSKHASIADTEKITLLLPDGNKVAVAASRIKPLMATLIDLFDGQPDGSLQLSKLDAPRIADVVDAGWHSDGLEMALQLAQRLQHSGGTQVVEPPNGLALQLRPYQRDGLAWLQFLRQQGLSGILADDMGLGKTAQTLAHLLLEKEAGRLDKPALIVLPTSLVHNWKHEAARFAPALRVLALHGARRKADFERIAEHDVVLTTYPLLWRDIDALGKQSYHTLILDEAQTVKNAGSRSAAAVRLIKAQHRLCVTGTPLENHLGELWALFDFLMPGFLGDSKHFAKLWRTPIEKHGDSGRMALLARRIKPFILRRRKDEVAKELPPKTVIVREVELQGSQRDLYETVRAAMDSRIQQEIASKGFARSQIVILDALLKLRQVCCDPRLVKVDSAKTVTERAKLTLLLEMLPELVEEGRRILLFSQFTSMLALIQEELQKAGLDYVLLTGDTTDRETPIQRFQAGEVPIFLISLKAGGVGLNLTAADTVIHFDPWWNPAAENQATDRAHRIGQQKPVFVYKLIVAGSIEEKILSLQDKKAELAAGILSEDHSGSVKFSAEDIAALLAPLPDNE